jgi:hypothetical protein
MRLSSILRRTVGVSMAALCTAMLAAAPARAEPAMWVVKDADSTIYLFGTVHLLRKDLAWKSPKVDKAMGESRELWLELIEGDDPAALAPLVQKYALDPARPLSTKLTAAQNAKLAEVAAKYGMQPAQLEPMKPWFAGLMLTLLPLQAAGYDADAGVETVLKATAKAEGDRLKAFETLDEQLGFFDGMPVEAQAAFLESVLDDADEGVAMLDKLAGAWARGDVDALGREMNDEMKAQSPALYDLLLTQRNKRWADKIEALLKGSGVQFIAVGAGHLAGSDSVQVQLKARGIMAVRQ